MIKLNMKSNKITHKWIIYSELRKNWFSDQLAPVSPTSVYRWLQYTVYEPDTSSYGMR